MLTEAVQRLIPDPEKPSGLLCHHNDGEPTTYVLPILPWDEIAQKWPKVRFSSFFPAY